MQLAARIPSPLHHQQQRRSLQRCTSAAASHHVSLPAADHSSSAGAAADRLVMLQQQLDRQCEPRPAYVPAADAPGRAKQLTADISHKQHWSQLHNTWLDNSGDFGPFHLTATLCRLARLVCRDGAAAADRPELFKFSDALLAAARQDADQLDSRGLAQCLWAYAKLQTAVPHSSASGDDAAAALVATLVRQGHVQQLQPSQLSQAAWAAASLQAMGMAVPAGWWPAIEQRTGQLMQWLKPDQTACCAWALTKNGHKLPAGLSEALQDHLVRMAVSYGPGELLQVMLALAGTQEQQQQQQQQSGSNNSWLAACYTRLQQEAVCMSAQEVSTAFLALGRLGARNRPSSQCGSGCHQLPLSLSVKLLKRALDTLPSSSPRDLVTMAYALARLELNPGPWWWASWLPYGAAALHVFSPSMLAVTAWSLAKLGVQPGAGWVQELLQQSGFKVQGFDAQEAAMLVYGLGKWGACPDLGWWAAFEDATHHMMPYFTAAELAALLSGMGSTGPPPAAPAQQQQQQPSAGVLWRARPAQHGDEQQAQQQLTHRTSASLQDALQQQQEQHTDYIPGGAWTAAMLVSAQGALSGAPAGALAGILAGLAKLAVQPSTAWMDAFEAAVLSSLPHAGLKDVAAVLWGLSLMAVQPSRALVQAVDSRIMTVLHSSTGRARAGAPTAAHAAGLLQPAQGVAAAAAAAAAHAAAADVGFTAAADVGPAHAGQAAKDAAHAAATAAGDLAPLQQWSGLLGRAAHVAPAPPAAASAGGADAPSAAVAAQLLWSVARLPVPEGVAAWADDLLLAVMPSLQVATQQTLFVLLRSLAWLKHTPGCRQWLDVWWTAYAAHLQPGGQLQGAAAAASSLDVHQQQQQQQVNPGTRLQSHAVLPQQQLKKLQVTCPAAESTCEQLTVVLWCFRQLHLQPSQQTGWLQAVVAATQPLLPRLSAERFSLLLCQLAQLHVWPGKAWLAHADAVLYQQRQHMSRQQAECAAASLAKMGWAGAAQHLQEVAP